MINATPGPKSRQLSFRNRGTGSGGGAGKRFRLLDVTLGLVLNFHEVKLVDGISRLILPGANKS